MALIYTPKGEFGSALPKFELKTVEGKSWSSTTIEPSAAKVIVFMCNHCPYVKAIENRLIQLAKDLGSRQVPLIAICSNDRDECPEDHPSELLKRWRDKNYNFDYLVDEFQLVAKAFAAVCTPDFFVYDNLNRLVYRGRLDDSWRDEQNVKVEELKNAVLRILSEQAKSTELIRIEQNPAMGCSIKWKN